MNVLYISIGVSELFLISCEFDKSIKPIHCTVLDADTGSSPSGKFYVTAFRAKAFEAHWNRVLKTQYAAKHVTATRLSAY